MVNYKKLREKFPGKKPAKSSAKAAAVKAIAREYAQKRAELGLTSMSTRRGFPYYMAILMGMMLLGAVVIPRFMKSAPKIFNEADKLKTQAENEVRTLAVALGRCRYHAGAYPSTEQGLLELELKHPTLKGSVGPYIVRLKPDPWNNDYVYVCNGEGELPTLYSMGPDGRPGTTDDILAPAEAFDEPFRDTSWDDEWVPQHLRGYVVVQNERHRAQIEADLDKYLHSKQSPLGERVISAGWEFAPARVGAEVGFASETLDWRPVVVPHDWVNAGLPWRGVGYYRRRNLFIPPAALGCRVALRFDGVMARPEVTFNGEKVGGWDYGYMGFTVDVTGLVRYGGANDIVVRVDTSAQDGRLCPGAGLLRDVKLVIEDNDERIEEGSLRLTTLSLTEELARMRAVYRTPAGVETNDFEVVHPILWEPSRPFLHHVTLHGKDIAFGIRTAEFTADDGFRLNGRRFELKGFDLPADFGSLGAIYRREAARRLLLTLKDMGVNALRTSRHPVDPDFLTLCDELGFLVRDEAFDRWDATAGLRDDEDQDAYVIRNLKALVRRDRNHPCVICWSVGDAIPPRTEAYPNGSDEARCAKYRAAVLEEDETRPVVMGCDAIWNIAAGDEAPLDPNGLPTDRFHYYRSLWNDRADTVHLLPHWNQAEEGRPVTVVCYTSGDEAELFVNGESAGIRRKTAAEPLSWDVPYEEGEIKAIVRKKGVYIGEKTVRTALKPVAIRLRPEADRLADGELMHVTVDVVDDAGVPHPLAQNEIGFAVEGPAEIVAVGNGSTCSTRVGAATASCPLAGGRAVVIVRRTGGSGQPFKLIATAKGLRTASVRLHRRWPKR